MKILIIWRLLTVGGVNAGWRNRAIYFKKHGIETEFLYTKDHGGLHIMEDVAPVYLTRDDKEIIKIIQQNNYDAVIVVDTGSAYKWLRKAKYKGPVLVEARTPELIKLQPHISKFRGIEPKTFIVPSNYQRNLISILLDTEHIPVNVVYNGVATSFFRPLKMEEISFSQEPIWTKNKKIIGWIGRIDKRKNWPMLVEVAKMIKSRRDDIEIWVIGGAQSIQREDFRNKWEEEGLTDIMKWFPVIPYQQMPHVYAKILHSGGCTLATTKSESFGNTFIEAMACGVPVVASNIRPITELVKRGKTGLTYRGQNVEDAVNQLYRILDNPPLHQEMSQNAVAHVRENFAIEKVAEQYVQLIKTLVHESNDSSGVGSQ